MSSGWVDSGIDWDNITNNRTEDVVRELYYAVKERDWWIRYFIGAGLNGFPNDILNPLIDYPTLDDRVRFDEQLTYINNTVGDWLRGFAGFGGTTRSWNTNRGVFLNPNTEPQDDWDTSNGNISNQRKFLYNWQSYTKQTIQDVIGHPLVLDNNTRVNPIDLGGIYKLLTSNTPTICLKTNAYVDDGFNSPTKGENIITNGFLSNYDFDNGNQDDRVKDCGGVSSEVNDADTNYYSDYIANVKNQIDFGFRIDWRELRVGYSYAVRKSFFSSPESYDYRSNHYTPSLDINGFSLSDFGFSQITYGSAGGQLGDSDDNPVYPDESSGWFVYNSSTPNKSFPIRDYDLEGNATSSGDFLSYAESFAIPQLILDKPQGFLKYYTESTP